MSANGVAAERAASHVAADAPVRVLLVAGDEGAAREVRAALTAADDVHLLAEVTHGDGAARARAAAADVVLLDLRAGTGVEFLDAIGPQRPRAAVLALGATADADEVRAVLRAGARGYLLAPVARDELVSALRRAAAGRLVLGDEVLSLLVDAFVDVGPASAPPVTPREHEVLALLAEGLPNRAVADRLGISTRTAQKHVENLFKKFNVHCRSELVRTAGRSGIMN